MMAIRQIQVNFRIREMHDSKSALDSIRPGPDHYC